MFKAGELERVIIFSGKKDKVKDITRELKHMKINCAAMHSDLSQAERDDVMYRFKAGQVSVLVATDIVARGIDIDDILCVINYDVPRDAEDYVHRIGRTARAQRDGVAITLVSDNDMRQLLQALDELAPLRLFIDDTASISLLELRSRGDAAEEVVTARVKEMAKDAGIPTIITKRSHLILKNMQ